MPVVAQQEIMMKAITPMKLSGNIFRSKNDIDTDRTDTTIT